MSKSKAEASIRTFNHSRFLNVGVVGSILFLSWFLVILWNNRLDTADDYFMIQKFKEEGFFNALIHWEYNKRFTSFFVFNALFYFGETVQDFRWLLFSFQSAFYLIFFLVLAKTIQWNFHRHLGIVTGKREIFVLATTLFASCYFFTAQNNEVWFWLSAQVVHFVPLVFLMLGIELLQNKRVLINMLALLLFFLSGGGSEVIAVLTAIIFCLLFVKSGARNTMMLLAAGIILLPLFWTIISNSASQRVVLEQLYQSEYSVSWIDFLSGFIFPAKMVLYLSLLPAFVFLGKILANHDSRQILLKINLQKLFYIFILIDLVLFLVNYAIVYKVFHSFGPLRSWSYLSMILMLQGCCLAFCVGVKYFSTIVQVTSLLLLGFFVLLFSYFALRQVKITKVYANAFDQRLEVLVKQRKEIQAPKLQLEKLPDSGILISVDDPHYMLLYMKIDPKRVEVRP